MIFGPKRLPEIGGAMGRGIRDFRQAMSQVGEPDEEKTAQLAEPEVVIQSDEPEEVPGEPVGSGETMVR